MAHALVETLNGIDYKAKLANFCQRYTKGCVRKEEIEYKTEKKAAGVYQTTVRLALVGDQVFSGEPQANMKESEKSAAYQALIGNADKIATLRPSGMKTKGAQALLHSVQVSGVPSDRAHILGMDHILSQEQERLGLKRPAPADEMIESKIAKAEAAATTGKILLNSIISKILKRPLTKGEMSYETAQVEGGGYQSTVTVGCLPEICENNAWNGAVSEDRKAAEQSAAEHAVECLAELPRDCIAALAISKPSKSSGPCLKVQLNAAVMKLIRKPLAKGDIVYATAKVECGHQSSVTVMCLPGGLAGTSWTGEACRIVKGAEQSAAAVAIREIGKLRQ